MRVFLTYARIDDRLAAEVAAVLDELGIEPFNDAKERDWGRALPLGIREDLGAADALLAIISPASLGSAWLPFEVGWTSALDKAVLGFVCHPSLELPGYLQNAHLWATLGDLRGYFTGSAAAPLPAHLSVPAAALSETAAAIGIDLMRLLLCLAIPRTYEAHRKQYPDLFAVARRDFKSFSSEWMTAELVDEGLRAKLVLLHGRLQWLLERLRRPLPQAGIPRDDLAVFVKLHGQVVELVAGLRPEGVKDIRAWVAAQLPPAVVDAASTVEDLLALRHRVQGAFLESGQIRTIWDDVDHKLAVPFLMIDEVMLPLFSRAVVRRERRLNAAS